MVEQGEEKGVRTPKESGVEAGDINDFGLHVLLTDLPNQLKQPSRDSKATLGGRPLILHESVLQPLLSILTLLRVAWGLPHLKSGPPPAGD